jgi:glycosyltransferase involved in cell wall biosynthesis
LQQPKLLMLVEWFAPGYKAGGPIRSCVNMCLLLRKYYNIYVVTTSTDFGNHHSYEGIVQNEWITDAEIGVQVYYISPAVLSRKLIKQLIAAVNPQYVYTQLIFSPLFCIYPTWLAFRRHINAKFIICPRGTLYDSALAVKPYKKMPLLKLYRWLSIAQSITFHATSNKEANAIEKYFPKSKMIVAKNLPALHQSAFCNIHKVNGELACIFIARIVPIKNLLFVLQVLQRVRCGVQLTIVGPAEDEKYWEECKNFIATLPVNISVTILGPQPAPTLPALLQQHHLFLLPTLGENFGHAIFEALAAGRPVLISDQTPWQNLEAHQCGWHFPLTQKEKYVAVIERLAACSETEYEVFAKNAWYYAQHYIQQSSVVKPYLELFS